MQNSSWLRVCLRWIALFLCILPFACFKSPHADKNQIKVGDQIKVGVFLSLTGAEGIFGQDALRGIQLATDELNASGGVLGRKIQLVVRDNQSKPGETSLIVRRLIRQDKVPVLLGEVASGRSLEAAAIAQASKIPMITSATNPRVTEVGNFIFRIGFTDYFQGEVIAKFMQSLGFKRVAIISDSSQDYSIGLAESFSKYFTAHGGKIVKWQDYYRRDKDFHAQITAIKTAHPEAVFLPSYYTEAPLVIKQAHQLGLDVPFVGGDGWDSEELFKLGGADMEGTYFANHFSPENQEPIIQNFVKSFQYKYGMMPPSTAAGTYDSMKLLADAIQRAGSTNSEEIRKALESTKNFPAVTGTIHFDKNRNPPMPAVIIRIRNEKFTYYTTIYP